MRRKIPKNETLKEKQTRVVKDKIVSSSRRGERLAWDRKMKNMEKLIDELRPIEEKILEITKNEKYPIMDKIEEVRKIMINECVHPEEYLVIESNHSYAHCKFCGKNITWHTS